MTLRFFYPSWHGDFRLEAIDERSCRLVFTKPTPAEQLMLLKFARAAHVKGLWPSAVALTAETFHRSGECTLAGPIGELNKLLVRLVRPTKPTLTAVKFADGRLEIAKGSDSRALDELIDQAVAEKAAAGVSVQRPTPSCPNCVPGAIGAASEVLLEFLAAREHALWAKHRALLVTGQRTGHRYRICHRHSPMAVKQGRICYDIDDQVLIHFHDQSVPPEEEVLAAKLVLEHAEDWLRNEATLFDPSAELRFKNPFGDHNDGVADAALTAMIGGFALARLEARSP